MTEEQFKLRLEAMIELKKRLLKAAEKRKKSE